MKSSSSFSVSSSTARQGGSDRQLPALVGSVLGRLPLYPGSFLFVKGLNLLLLPSIHEDCKAAMLERRFRIEVSDAKLTFDFSYNGRHFVAVKGGPAEPDLLIRAKAYDFHLLMQKKEDADTLFFSRRLTMTGDTELGVMIKNTMDALDLPEVLPPTLLRVLKQFDR